MQSFHLQGTCGVKVCGSRPKESSIVNTSNELEERFVLDTQDVGKRHGEIQHKIFRYIRTAGRDQTHVEMMHRHIHRVVRQWHGIVEETRGGRSVCGSIDVFQTGDHIKALAVNKVNRCESRGRRVIEDTTTAIVDQVVDRRESQSSRASMHAKFQRRSTTRAARVARSVGFGALGTRHWQWFDHVCRCELPGAGTRKGTLLVERIKRQRKVKEIPGIQARGWDRRLLIGHSHQVLTLDGRGALWTKETAFGSTLGTEQRGNGSKEEEGSCAAGGRERNQHGEKKWEELVFVAKCVVGPSRDDFMGETMHDFCCRRSVPEMGDSIRRLSRFDVKSFLTIRKGR